MDNIYQYWLNYNSDSYVHKFKEYLSKFNIPEDDIATIYSLISTPVFRTIVQFKGSGTKLGTFNAVSATTAHFRLLDLDLLPPWEVKFTSTVRVDVFVTDNTDNTDWKINTGIYTSGSNTVCPANQPYNVMSSYGENGFYIPSLPNSVYRYTDNSVVGSDNTFSANRDNPNPTYFYGYREYADGEFDIFNGVNWINIPRTTTFAIRPGRACRIYTVVNDTTAGEIRIV